VKTREVKRIVQGYATEDGAGVKLIRVLGNNNELQTAFAELRNGTFVKQEA